MIFYLKPLENKVFHREGIVILIPTYVPDIFQIDLSKLFKIDKKPFQNNSTKTFQLILHKHLPIETIAIEIDNKKLI